MQINTDRAATQDMLLKMPAGASGVQIGERSSVPLAAQLGDVCYGFITGQSVAFGMRRLHRPKLAAVMLSFAEVAARPGNVRFIPMSRHRHSWIAGPQLATRRRRFPQVGS